MKPSEEKEEEIYNLIKNEKYQLAYFTNLLIIKNTCETILRKFNQFQCPSPHQHVLDL